MTQYKFVRMKMTAYKIMRRAFKGLRNESASDYFDRVAGVLDFMKGFLPKMEKTNDKS